MLIKALRFVLFAFLLLAVGCSKKKMTHYPVNAELKAAFNYKPGTYWIYRDSISGEVDSFFVTRYDSSFHQEPEKDYSYDVITIRVAVLNIEPKVDTEQKYFEYAYVQNAISAYYRYKDTIWKVVEYVPLINYPYEKALTASVGLGNVYSINETGSLTNTFPTYIVTGKTFNNVAEVNHISEINYSSYNDWYYFSPDAGIIKMRLHRIGSKSYDKIWELQRWKFNK